MKIKNTEAFRTELFKNMKDMYFTACNICTLACTEYREEDIRPENKNTMAVRKLNNVLYVEKYHHNAITWEKMTAVQLYLTVMDDGVYFFTANHEQQRFNYEMVMDFVDYPNKMVFMMDVAVKVAEFVR